MLNIATSVRKWHYAIKVSIAMSFIIYGCCLVFLRHFFMLSKITWQFGLKVLLITAAAWIPVKVYDIIKSLVSPTLAKKIRNEKKSKNLLNTLPSSNNTIHGDERTKD